MTAEQKPRRTLTPARATLMAMMLALSAGILGWLVYRQRDVLMHYDWHLRWELILASFVLFSIGLGLVAIVWGWVVTSLGAQGPLVKHIRYYSIANIAKRLPGTVWYVASRTLLYKQGGFDPTRVVIASGIELALLVMSGIVASLMFAAPTIVQWGLSGWSFGIAFAVGCIMVQPQFVGWVLRKFKVETQFSFRYVDLVKWFMTYLVVWIIGGLVLYIIGSSFAIIRTTDLPYVIGCWSLTGLISSTVFFLPSNLGVTEVTLSLLLARIMPSSVAVVVALSVRILLFLYEVIWAVIWFRAESPARYY
jgi:hypothetical protein